MSAQGERAAPARRFEHRRRTDPKAEARERETGRQCWQTALLVDGRVTHGANWEISGESLPYLDMAKKNAEREIERFIRAQVKR